MFKIVIFSALLILSSCSQSQSDIDAAKEQILNPKPDIEQIDQSSENLWEQVEVLANKVSSSNKEAVMIIPQDAVQFLDFDSIWEEKLSSGEVEITGETLRNVDKIQVLFVNKASEFPRDEYILQTFNPGDDSFRYVASSRNKVLDFGENVYTFRAFSGKEVSETRVVLRVPKSWAIVGGDETSTSEGSSTKLSFESLPVDASYGEAIKLGEDSFTYSQIKWLEVRVSPVANASCASLTDFLKTRITTWFYWNTCRDLVSNKALYYNVIRLEGEAYVYERHYVDFVHSLYGSYELERGEWVTSENIAEKNTELKGKVFENLEIVDGLMRDIVNS